MATSPTAFTKARAEAITKHGGWTVLGTGTVFAGRCGAVHVRDQYGDEGLVVQQYAGSPHGTTMPLVTSYREVETAA